MTALRSPLLAVLLLSSILLGFGAYRLTESPGTWVDEGMIDQLAVNLTEHGVMGLQTSPGNFESGAYITAGFPLIFPLAAVFNIFGIGILLGRALMLIFALACILTCYAYLRKEFGARSAIFGGLLIATFPPFYAYAKNILGEVPGLFFFFLLLFLLWKYEKESSSGSPSRNTALAIGLALGLTIATKPVFLPLLGALGVVTLWSWWKKTLPPLSFRTLIFVAMGFLIPIVAWLCTQFFPTDPIGQILSFYANPYGVEHVPGTMWKNFLRFFTETSAIYVALAYGTWAVSLFIRARVAVRISFAEKTAFAFSSLVLAFYLRTPGWYKYFFIPQIITLAYFPAALRDIFSRIPLMKKAAVGATASLCLLLASFHGYMLMNDSFVAESYQSTRSAALQNYFNGVSTDKKIFIYRAPEAVIFLPEGIEYGQYIYMNKAAGVGEKEAARIGVDIFPDIILTATTEGGTYYQERFPGYALKEYVDRYAVLVRISS